LTDPIRTSVLLVQFPPESPRSGKNVSHLESYFPLSGRQAVGRMREIAPHFSSFLGWLTGNFVAQGPRLFSRNAATTGARFVNAKKISEQQSWGPEARADCQR
jgi:hypothetical protein